MSGSLPTEPRPLLKMGLKMSLQAKYRAFITVVLVLLLASLAMAATSSFHWRKSLDDLNDPTTYANLPTTGDRAMVISDENATVFYRFDGIQWIPCGSVSARGWAISGIIESQNNTTALEDNMTAGDVYRTGDTLKVVH